MKQKAIKPNKTPKPKPPNPQTIKQDPPHFFPQTTNTRVTQLPTLKEKPHNFSSTSQMRTFPQALFPRRGEIFFHGINSPKKNFIENFIQHTTFSSKKRQYTGRVVVHCGYRNKIKYWKRM